MLPTQELGRWIAPGDLRTPLQRVQELRPLRLYSAQWSGPFIKRPSSASNAGSERGFQLVPRAPLPGLEMRWRAAVGVASGAHQVSPRIKKLVQAFPVPTKPVSSRTRSRPHSRKPMPVRGKSHRDCLACAASIPREKQSGLQRPVLGRDLRPAKRSRLAQRDRVYRRVSQVAAAARRYFTALPYMRCPEAYIAGSCGLPLFFVYDHGVCCGFVCDAVGLKR